MQHFKIGKGHWVLAGSLALAGAISMPWPVNAQQVRQPKPFSTLAPDARTPVSRDMHGRTSRHIQSRRLSPAEYPPLPASKEHMKEDYDRPVQKRLTTFASPLAADCDTGIFAGASGAALVAAVKGSPVACLNQLYSISGAVAANIFNQNKMVTVANALQTASMQYAGNNGNQILQLITFLRAGYYVQFYYPEDVGAYGASLKMAIGPALDAFVANPHFDDVNDLHGEVLSEFVTLVDSAGENANQLQTVEGLLQRYNNSFNSYFYMVSAVNNVFTVLFRGHQNDDFRQRVGNDPETVNVLSAFISDHADQVGTDNEYLLSNAAREMARFLQYPGLESSLRPKVKNLLDRYGMVGNGASIWVATASTADYYDHDACGYYGICNFQADLKQAVLPIQHDCSATVRLRAQDLTSQEIAETCAEVLGETDYFHSLVHDGAQPVADDHNSTLELDIFRSSTDYQTYSGAIFGNSVDNGGIYLEGDPANPSNQARFIAYQAEWLLPSFEIWNLTHEYVHYLDGRFNMHGDFNDYMSVPSIWWIEGLAEYLSYSYRELPYDEAIDAAGTRQFTLSRVFDNTYNDSTLLVYRWGYLAARYMFEKQGADVTSILRDFRQGNYSGYASFLSSLHGVHDADWDNWLGCFSANGGDTTTCGGFPTPPPGDVPPVDPPPSNLPECDNPDNRALDVGCGRSGLSSSRENDMAYFYVPVGADTPTLVISTSGGSGNADLYVSSAGWPTTTWHEQASQGDGNAESVTVPSSGYPGYIYIAVHTRSPYAGVSIGVESPASAP